MSQTVQQISEFLGRLAPLRLGETWDNLGLIVGRGSQPVRKIMTCLTLTPDVAQEAVDQQVDLIVSHHPLMFKPVKKISDHTGEGELILNLIENRIAVYSPHTAYDSAADGINQQLAESFRLESIQPLRILPNSDGEASGSSQVGAGRFGVLSAPVRLSEFLDFIKSTLNLESLQYVGEPDRMVQKISFACGSAGEFVEDALRLRCDLFVTGETRFHTCLDARTAGIGLVMLGHYASERPGVEQLATRLQQEFPEVECFASLVESDPVRFG